MQGNIFEPKTVDDGVVVANWSINWESGIDVALLVAQLLFGNGSLQGNHPKQNSDEFPALPESPTNLGMGRPPPPIIQTMPNSNQYFAMDGFPNLLGQF